MYGMHPVVALDLARDRSRALDAEIERRRRASVAGAEAAPAGPPGRSGGPRRAAVMALRALATGAGSLAGSAGRAACRLEGDPA